MRDDYPMRTRECSGQLYRRSRAGRGRGGQTMTRPIDANALLKKWQDMLDIKTGEKEEIAVYKIFEILIKRLNQEPTIDLVHAAGACYCRECTCWNRHDDILPDCRFPDWGYCSKMLDSDSEIEITTLENDFCSRGQRLEED